MDKLAKVRAYQNKVNQERRERIQQIMGSTCVHCQQDFPWVCLDLHHVDPSEKDHSVSKILRYKWSKIEEELKKCILLCANCHRLEHARLNEETKQEKAINDKFQTSLFERYSNISSGSPALDDYDNSDLTDGRAS